MLNPVLNKGIQAPILQCIFISPFYCHSHVLSNDKMYRKLNTNPLPKIQSDFNQDLSTIVDNFEDLDKQDQAKVT